MALVADGAAGSQTVTEHILDCVHDQHGLRYAATDPEWLEARLQLEIVRRKQVPLVTSSARVGIDQVGFQHLERLLRTPEPGLGWPVCASEPGCVAESFFRSCPSSIVQDFVRRLPCARLAVYLSPAELLTFDASRQLPIDAPLRQCVACVLNWQNKCAMQCGVASAVEGLGQTFEQRISMFAGVDNDGIHPDWLMLPGHAPLDRMSGFVMPMPFWATYGLVARIARDAQGLPCGVRLDPQPMQHSWEEQVRYRLHLAGANAHEAMATLAAWPNLHTVVADVALGRLPRAWSSLQAWQDADPTLKREMPWASTCPGSSAPCPLLFRRAVCGTAALVMQRSKEWLGSDASSSALALRPWIHYLQAQLLRVVQRPETWMGAPWPTGDSEPACLASSTPTSPLSDKWVVQGALPPLPDLETALLATCRLMPSDLARPVRDMELVPQQILHYLLTGSRSKATRLVTQHAMTFPTVVLEALVDDRIDHEMRFDTPLRQRFTAGLAPLEPGLTVEQRVYLWMAVASYLGGRVWQMPLRRSWQLAMMDAYWVLQDAANTCKSRTVDNTPLLADLISPNAIKLKNRALRARWYDKSTRPADANPDAFGSLDLVRWRAQAAVSGFPFGLQTQFKAALPVATFVSETLVNQQLLSQADGWARPKVLHHCLTCGYITQDQSREYNKDRRDKTPIYGSVGDSVTVEYCRWCFNTSGSGNAVVAIPLVGHVVQVGPHAWIMCTRCGQQVSVKNSTFRRYCEVLCLWCEDAECRGPAAAELATGAVLGPLVDAPNAPLAMVLDDDDSGDDSDDSELGTFLDDSGDSDASGDASDDASLMGSL